MWEEKRTEFGNIELFGRKASFGCQEVQATGQLVQADVPESGKEVHEVGNGLAFCQHVVTETLFLHLFQRVY